MSYRAKRILEDWEKVSGVKEDSDAKGSAPVGQDGLTSYLSEIAGMLLDQFELSEDEAEEYILDAADELEDDGTLPELPDEDASDEDAGLWTQAAIDIGFKGYVLKSVRIDFE